MTTVDDIPALTTPQVSRIEVHPLDPADDPLGRNLLHEVQSLSLAPDLREVRTARVYLIQSTLDQAALHRVASELLTDPVNQRFRLGSTPRYPDAALIEVHYLPGVMDPVAQSTTDAIIEMLSLDSPLQVRTGFRYDLLGANPEQASRIANRLLANPVIQSISDLPEWPQRFPQLNPYNLNITHVPLRDLDDTALLELSRSAHLFLSLNELQAIRDYFRAIDREPTDIELETLAQTWSEHCVHKTLKSTVSYTESSPASPSINDFLDRPNHSLAPDGSLVINNLLKSTIAAATNKLRDEGLDWCISVFVDNAGIIAFDETDALTFKVETHNHPSAIEPYGGAATGIGGCIRDTLGTGLGSKPVANTDIFAVAYPDRHLDDLPRGILHPRRILTQIVAGVRDYGNRMGIPTVNGAVYFDDRYLGNPLVFCGSVGIIPRDKCFGSAQPGDRIIAIGGRTGRDGIHGATFSSAELTDTHSDEFSHAVQIGNAITEKKVLDVLLQARDHSSGPLYHAVTDCGAGGFSSAVGEMGEKLGAFVNLDQAPLKYDGLSYTEIWISEAQERMVFAVPPDNLQTLLDLCRAEDVEACDLGYFGTPDAQLILNYKGTQVGSLSMNFLHEGIPTPTRTAEWTAPASPTPAPRTKTAAKPDDLAETLLALLAHPNIASKHWIIRQYDHEVQGGSAVKPLTGPRADGPSDAAVIRPKLSSTRACALSCGLATLLADHDPYWMTLAAIDEAVRNAVCVGAAPDRIAILDNFCWPNCEKPHNLGSLVRAAQACYDGALAYKTPFISGKDSLNNEFRTEDNKIIAIPPTLLISAIALLHDVDHALTMDAKKPGNLLLQVGLTTPHLAASHYQLIHQASVPDKDFPRVDLAAAPRTFAVVADLIRQNLIASAHDPSDGGMLAAAAEMAFAGRLGLDLDLAGVPHRQHLSPISACFAETPSRILIEVQPEHFDAVARALTSTSVPFGRIGTFNDSPELTLRNPDLGRLLSLSIDQLVQTWTRPLDW